MYPKGHEQARAIAEHLGYVVRDAQAIYSSPFVRALQTASPIARMTGARIHVEWGLSELLAHKWLQMEDPLPHLLYRDPASFCMSQDMPQTMFNEGYRSGPEPSYPECVGFPKGPADRSRCLERHMQALEHILLDNAWAGGTVIVTAHGATHNFLAEAACPGQQPMEDWKSLKAVANCSVTTLLRDVDGRWTLEGWGEQFIPEHLRSEH